MSKILAVTGVLASLLGCSSSDRLSGQDARRLVEEGAVLLDVRSAAEFESRHLPGSVNIPVGDLGARRDELPQIDTPVVVYCQSGVRSAEAARTLRAEGFSSVHDLGGIGNW